MVNHFYTADTVEQSVRNLVDAHVGSCVYEGAQICMTALDDLGYETEHDLWRHREHPCIWWAREAPSNWFSTYAFTMRAHKEWKIRDMNQKDEHGAITQLVKVTDLDRVLDLDWEGEASHPPKVCVDYMGDDYHSDDIGLIDAYRLYVANSKDHLHEWSDPRSEPDWVSEYKGRPLSFYTADQQCPLCDFEGTPAEVQTHRDDEHGSLVALADGGR